MIQLVLSTAQTTLIGKFGQHQIWKLYFWCISLPGLFLSVDYMNQKLWFPWTQWLFLCAESSSGPAQGPGGAFSATRMSCGAKAFEVSVGISNINREQSFSFSLLADTWKFGSNTHYNLLRKSNYLTYLREGERDKCYLLSEESKNSNSCISGFFSSFL